MAPTLFNMMYSAVAHECFDLLIVIIAICEFINKLVFKPMPFRTVTLVFQSGNVVMAICST